MDQDNFFLDQVRYLLGYQSCELAELDLILTILLP